MNSSQLSTNSPQQLTQVPAHQIQAPIGAQSTTVSTSTTTTTTTSHNVIASGTQQLNQPIALTSTANPTGPTALVIIPQHSATATITTSKTTSLHAAKTTSLPTAVSVSGPHVTLAATTQSTPIHVQAPTNFTTIAALPMTAHQQSNINVQPTLATRPPSTLSVVPITATPVLVKTEPTKHICCLLDNGLRCDRVAGNASFSARIQKFVGTKKMNFTLDPTVRHAYICEHHKAILTVAKKSTTLSRDNKTNARNYTANNTANALASQQSNKGNFNDLSVRQQQNLPHPVNLDMINNQNRLVGNHTVGLNNNMTMRPGGHQLAYGHYQGGHPNQLGTMDVMMSGNFDNAGGDSLATCSGGIDVDLQQLQVNTLRRYKRHFRVQTRPGLNKVQLAESLKNHFRTLPIIEKEAITYFVYIVKCYRNKLDHNPKAD